jgi:hypothetical protein
MQANETQFVSFFLFFFHFKKKTDKKKKARGKRMNGLPLIFVSPEHASQDKREKIEDFAQKNGILAAIFWTATPYCCIDLRQLEDSAFEPFTRYDVTQALKFDEFIFKNWIRTGNYDFSPEAYQGELAEMMPDISNTIAVLLSAGRIIEHQRHYVHQNVLHSLKEIEEWVRKRKEVIVAISSNACGIKRSLLENRKYDLIIDFSENNTTTGLLRWESTFLKSFKEKSIRIALIFFEKATNPFLYQLFTILSGVTISEILLHTRNQYESTTAATLIKNHSLLVECVEEFDEVPNPVQIFSYDPQSSTKFFQKFKTSRNNREAKTRLSSVLVVWTEGRPLRTELKQEIRKSLEASSSNRCFRAVNEASSGVIIKDSEKANIFHSYFAGKYFKVESKFPYEIESSLYESAHSFKQRVDVVFMIVAEHFRGDILSFDQFINAHAQTYSTKEFHYICKFAE